MTLHPYISVFLRWLVSKWSQISASFFLHAVPELLRLYNDLATIITTSILIPNSGPDSVQIFLWHLVLSNEIPMPHGNISNSFKYESRNAIITQSLDMILDYVFDYYHHHTHISSKLWTWLCTNILMELSIKVCIYNVTCKYFKVVKWLKHVSLTQSK